jgi:hypothetical protein
MKSSRQVVRFYGDPANGWIAFSERDRAVAGRRRARSENALHLELRVRRAAKREWLILLAAGALALPSASALEDTLKIESGTISGLATGEDKDVRVFKGIPFAAPPVGELRWKPP